MAYHPTQLFNIYYDVNTQQCIYADDICCEGLYCQCITQQEKGLYLHFLKSSASRNPETGDRDGLINGEERGDFQGKWIIL